MYSLEDKDFKIWNKYVSALYHLASPTLTNTQEEPPSQFRFSSVRRTITGSDIPLRYGWALLMNFLGKQGRPECSAWFYERVGNSLSLSSFQKIPGEPPRLISEVPLIQYLSSLVPFEYPVWCRIDGAPLHDESELFAIKRFISHKHQTRWHKDIQ